MPESVPSTTSEKESKISVHDDAKLARWPVPYERLTVPTRYGNTHIIASGRQDAPPLILIHAMGVTSTMWLPNIATLSRDYRTYALDTIGDQGQSVLYRDDVYPNSGRAFSEWLVDVSNELKIAQAYVMGSSFGGWITMNHAIYAADRVKRIVLLGPMGLPSWLTTLKVLSNLWPVMLFPTKSNIDRIIRYALGDNPSVREDFADYLTIGAKSLSKFRLPAPLPLSDDQLQKLKSPTLLMLGERDNVIGNAREVAGRANRLIPQVKAEIIPAAGHMMNTESPELVNALVPEFLQEQKEGGGRAL